jgi:hypothetical protein
VAQCQLHASLNRGGFSYPSLNNFSPRDRAFGHRGVVALIDIAPVPNRWRGCTGIRRVFVAVIIAAIIGGGR